MKEIEHERRDWIIVATILLFGLLCVIIVGQWAIRFSPSWKLNANMGSNLDPNSDYLTNRPIGFIEAIDSSILTQPVWINIFLTPDASIPTRALITNTAPLLATSTRVPATNTNVPANTPTSTLIYFPPPQTATLKPSYTKTPTPKATSTSTLIPASTATSTPTSSPTLINTPLVADLQITKGDNATTYVPNGMLTYTVSIINNGPSGVTGAVIADNIPFQIASWSWICASQNGGATGCDPTSNTTTNFNDTINLPNGASIVYTVTASISSSASGDLINSASITAPAGVSDLIAGNNSASDTDQAIISSTFPDGNIGTTKDGQVDVLVPGASLTLALNSPLVVGEHAGYDLVFYELANGTGIAMDLVKLEISDGYNWYTIFSWGEDPNVADTNSNMDISVIGGAETDDRDFTYPPLSDILYNSTGILIQLDGVVPDGIYPYIRITSPVTGDIDGGCEIDGIEVLP